MTKTQAMADAKHTPGPWGVGWNGGLTGPTISPTIFLPKGCMQIPIHREKSAVAFILRDGKETPEDIANARLIAAAPELLEALQRCEDALAALFDQGAVSESFMAGCTTLGNTRIHALAAIAKATGSAQ